MANNLYEQEIDKTVDWGDVNGKAVSGKYVQKFIKDTLNKKFGYLYYNRSALKYYVFADQDDYNTWTADPSNHDDLILGSFDAPAPASITFNNQSKQQIVILQDSLNTAQTISFNYRCLDSSSSPIAEPVTIKISSVCGSVTKELSETKQVDFDNYASDKGTPYSKDISSILSVGDNTITVTVTGNTTSASTILTWQYSVVDLGFSLNFDNSSAIDVANETFTVEYTATGGSKLRYLQVYIDGVIVDQHDRTDGVYDGCQIKASSGAAEQKTIYLTKTDGSLYWEAGMHTLQVRCYIAASSSENLYSNTEYAQFVIVSDEADENSYILIKQTISGAEDAIMAPDAQLEATATQYSGLLSPIEYCVYSATGASLSVDFDIYTADEYNKLLNGETATATASLPRSASSEIASFDYTFMTSGEYYIYAHNTLLANSLVVDVIVTTNADVDVTEKTGYLKAKFSALNRSNDEPESARTTWSGGNGLNATFKNVLWNKQSGWVDDALKLKNGAQVSIPLNLFADATSGGSSVSYGCMGTAGMTFEIDMKTFDSADDDSVVMDFSSTNSVANSSFIKITSTSATIQSQNGQSITTNFKDNSRVKLAFIVNNSSSPYPNTIMIMVNGVFDRVIDISSSDTWAWSGLKDADLQLTIGNPSGEVGVNIYSIRVYSTALTFDEELDNYIYDSEDIVSDYEDNALVTDDNDTIADGYAGTSLGKGKTIDIKAIRKRCRTMVVYGDLNLLENEDVKGHNYEYDIEYYDPQNVEKSFFVRHAYLSCQGTSSMQYPQKNLRFYLNKKYTDETDKETKGCGANVNNYAKFKVKNVYNTEFYPYGYYTLDANNSASQCGDPSKLGQELEDGTRNGLPFSVNSKGGLNGPDDDHKFYHRLDDALAKSIYDGGGAQLFTIKTEGKDENGDDIKKLYGCRYGDLTKTSEEYYMFAYLPIDYDYAVRLRQVGFKLYTISKAKTTDDEGNEIDATAPAYVSDDTNTYVIYEPKKVKSSKALSKKTQYYVCGNTWSQSDEVAAGTYLKANNNKQGLTDRWTLKTDFAESSMTHNAGLGSLWGQVLKNLSLNDYACRTDAQINAEEQGNWFDVRTSCFGLPMVLFKASMTINEDGSRSYGEPEFVGQFNWMTDKGSTALFGFEDMYNTNGEAVYDQSADTFCFEGSVNGARVIKGTSITFDLHPTADQEKDVNYQDYIATGSNGKKYLTGSKREIWTECEQRWPDPDVACNVDTYFFESFVRWVNFCQPAVDYKIDGQNGYGYSQYVELTFDEATERNAAGETLYARYYDEDTGEYAYARENTAYTDDETGKTVIASDNVFNAQDSTVTWYRKLTVDRENVSKELNLSAIGKDIFIGKVAGFDANVRFPNALAAYDDLEDKDDWEDSDGYLNYAIPADDLKKNNVEKYYVNVYLTQDGSKWKYTDEFNEEATYTESVSKTDDYEKTSDGKSWKSYTYMDYFKATKWDHLDVYKVAAYYIYLMRFAGVDQVIKNTMTTTSDRQHFYYINYDNDTCCGVRNDGVLKFNWDVDRDTFDISSDLYAFAGADSVLWNCLEMDTEFMDIVKAVDNAMCSEGLLTYNVVIEMMNDRFVHYWAPRLYNKQEYIKYLQPYFNEKSSTGKYLNFCHGTRESHRSWWLYNRFNLYDSKWKSGSYMNSRIQMYYDGMPASISSTNRQRLIVITAASKYYFLLTHDTITEYEDDWFQELKAGKYFNFKASKGYSIGNPFAFIGAEKVKSINFRPGNSYLTGAMALIAGSASWPTDKGILMTQLLIGDADPTVQVTLKSLQSLNQLTTLEELDVRYCKYLADAEISNLDNLHIFRAKGARWNSFSPAAGVTLYEVSLPDGSTQYVDDKGNAGAYNHLHTLNLNNVTFTANPNEYVEVSEYQAENADNDANIYGKTYSIYRYNTKTGEYEEATYNQNDMYNENDTTYDGKYYAKYEDASFLFPVFDYTPTEYLTSVTLNNVQSDTDADGNKYFDDYAFVNSWIDVIKNYINTGNLSAETAKNYTLSLKNVNWTNVPVSFITEVLNTKVTNDETGEVTYEPYITIANNGYDLTGKIKVVGSNNGKLTLEEYEALCKATVYGENVFDPTSPLVFDAEEAIFFTAGGDETVTTEDYKAGKVATTLKTDETYYNYVRGDKDTLRATIFPSDSSRVLEYMLMNYYNNQWQTATRTEKDGIVTYSIPNAGITVTSKNNIGTLSTDAEITGSNFIRIIVKDTANNKTYNDAIIYGVINEVIMPTSLKINSVNGTADVDYKIADSEKAYEYEIVLDKQDTMNVDVKTITITTNNDTLAKVVSTSIDNTANHRVYKFAVQYTMPNSTNENPTTDVTLTASVTYDSTASKTTTGTFKATLKPVKATVIVITDESGNEIPITGTNANKYTISKTGNSIFKISFGGEKYNIPVNDATFSDCYDLTLSGESIEGFTLNVKDNLKNGVYQSFSYKQSLTISTIDKYGNELSRTIEFTASIVYPEIMYLTRGDYENDKPTNMVTSVDIALTDCEGTSNPNSLTGFKHYGVSVDGTYKAQFFINVESNSEGAVTIPYKVNDLTVTITDTLTGNNVVTCDKVNDETYGFTGFNLTIPALSKNVTTTKVTVTATCVFDSNEDGTSGGTNEIVRLSKDFEITRSVAYATTYTKLNASGLLTAAAAKDNGNMVLDNLFIIDNKGRYYLPSSWIDATSLDNTITAVGVCYAKVSGGSVNAVGIYLKNMYYNSIMTADMYNKYVSKTGSDANSGSTAYNWSSSSPKNGLQLTAEINQFMSENGATCTGAAIYEVYHLLDKQGLVCYLPSSAEAKTYGTLDWVYSSQVNTITTLLNTVSVQNGTFATRIGWESQTRDGYGYWTSNTSGDKVSKFRYYLFETKNNISGLSLYGNDYNSTKTLNETLTTRPYISLK